jgi:hypothetical protein
MCGEEAQLLKHSCYLLNRNSPSPHGRAVNAPPFTASRGIAGA